MTVYQSETHPVGGLHTHGGDIERHTDPEPDGLVQVWEVEAGNHWCRYDDGLWRAVGEGDSVELTWTELVTDFGPVTDDEEACDPFGGGA